MLNGASVFNLVLLSCSAWFFAMSRALPSAYSAGQIGPNMFPMIVSGLGVLVMLGVVLQDLGKRSKPTTNQAIPVSKIIGALAVGGLLLGYILLLPAFGFRASTAIFLFLGILICNAIAGVGGEDATPAARLAFLAAIVALICTFMTYSVFTYGFGLNLS